MTGSVVPGRPKRIRTTPIEFVHDLGVVLTRGQTIEHEFRMVNPTDRAIRILAAHAVPECCSDVVAVPDSIPAKSAARLHVRYKPGFGQGRKDVQFIVRTDREEAPCLIFHLFVETVPEVTVSVIEPSCSVLLIGESGEQRLRITARRHKGHGPAAPQTVTGLGDVKARLIGEPIERFLENEVVETSREVHVDVPPRARDGAQVGSLLIDWSDGSTWEHTIRWRVAPHITATPDGLVIHPSDRPTRNVMISSRTSPFRIIDVKGPEALSGVQFSHGREAALRHMMRLEFDRHGAAPLAPFDVAIETDHPSQPTVVVSVLIVPRTNGAMP